MENNQISDADREFALATLKEAFADELKRLYEMAFNNATIQGVKAACDQFEQGFHLQLETCAELKARVSK